MGAALAIQKGVFLSIKIGSRRGADQAELALDAAERAGHLADGRGRFWYRFIEYVKGRHQLPKRGDEQNGCRGSLSLGLLRLSEAPAFRCAARPGLSCAIDWVEHSGNIKHIVVTFER
jgi:hypothetical protein